MAIWYRKQNDAWYGTVNGKQTLLAHGRRSQQEAMAKLVGLASATTPTAAELVEAYLREHVAQLKPSTRKRYGFFCRSFAASCGEWASLQVTPILVDGWIAQTGWSQATIWTAKTVVLAAFRWGVRSGLLTANPLLKLRKPPQKSRGGDCLISPQDHQTLYDAAPLPLQRVLFALYETGARPHEVLNVTADDFDAGSKTWTLHDHKTDGTGYARVIVLTEPLVALCKELAIRWPTGPMFRNSRNRPFKTASVANRVLELRKRLGIKSRLIPYGYRHTFATDALASGVSDSHVAAMLGHRSTTMVHKHYGHLTSRVASLRDSLKRTRPT